MSFFSGLVTYYIDGERSDRHHLMEESAAQPRLSYGVRGNIFSFLLDWDQTQEDLSKLLGEGDVEAWPVEPSRAAQIVRVRLTHGREHHREVQGAMCPSQGRT